MLVKATKLVIERFRLYQFGLGSGAFALRPDYLVKKKLAMDLLVYNDFASSLAIVTGIPPTINVREEYE